MSEAAVITRLVADLEALVGADHVRTTLPDRDAYARDLWPRAQLERLTHTPPTRPDAVVWPADVEQVAGVVRLAAAAGVPIVPFGAGSGVCGGARPIHGGLVVDLKRLKRVWSIDVDAGVLDVGAGINGELLERRLNREGVSLGHFPSSILCSTVGGWLAGRSAGQCSSRYGKIEDMIIDLEVVTGDGEIRRTAPTGVAQGLDWNQIFVGSEGTLGLITRARLKLHPLPAHRTFRGYLMPDIDAGLAVMRGIMQSGRRPAVLRMYDALDTLMVGSDPNAPRGGPLSKLKELLLGGGGKGKAMTTLLGQPVLVNRLVDHIPPKALLVVLCEGEEAEAEADCALVDQIAEAAGATHLGEGPGRAWLAHRYDVSYKQSTLYKGGAFVDTFEVATTWSKVSTLYEAVRAAVGEHVVVMAHFSHAYPGGCSIYFTFAGAGPDRDAQLKRYDAAWQAGLDTVVAFDAAIAHHHGAGLSRASHMQAEHGPAAAWFRALKQVLDPRGILNPGKLFTEADR